MARKHNEMSRREHAREDKVNHSHRGQPPFPEYQPAEVIVLGDQNALFGSGEIQHIFVSRATRDIPNVRHVGQWAKRGVDPCAG